MTANFDQFPERRITESIKWRYYPEDVLPMWVADMDFVSPEPVVAALQNRAAHGVYGYAEKMPALKEAIVGWLADRHGWQVQPDALVLLPGVVTGLNMAAHAFGESGDNVLVQTPVYAPFLEVPGNAGR
ncbi:MAG TPA: aminotransferase class I/II-fold pyridoxal phosphate-dependent enzyme, partial [Anaerolineaceae bacterium]|nr:aminotransferase class I/II-fold pyridoxal phosphate-dependent enzyme [Anaerolineaceae bacterium]